MASDNQSDLAAKTRAKPKAKPRAAMEARGAIRDELRAFRRDRILLEAAELFYERGYSGTTLDAIAERLQVTKPFIYYYCHNKMELLVDICARTGDVTEDAVDRAVAAGGPPRQRLTNFVRNFMRAQVENQRLVAVFFREERNLPDDVRGRINSVRGNFDARLAQVLEDGVKDGSFKVQDVRLAALAIGGMMAWSFTWYKPDGRLTIDDICEEMVVLALNAAQAG